MFSFHFSIPVSGHVLARNAEEALEKALDQFANSPDPSTVSLEYDGGNRWAYSGRESGTVWARSDEEAFHRATERECADHASVRTEDMQLDCTGTVMREHDEDLQERVERSEREAGWDSTP